MVFNPKSKQAIEVICSVKKKKPEHPDLVLTGVPVARHEHAKLVGTYLDRVLNFSKHIREAVLKALKGVSPPDLGLGKAGSLGISQHGQPRIG